MDSERGKRPPFPEGIRIFGYDYVFFQGKPYILRLENFQLYYNTYSKFLSVSKDLESVSKSFFEKSLRTCRRGKKVGTFKTIFPISGLVLELSGAT